MNLTNIKFERRKKSKITKMSKDQALKKLTKKWINNIVKYQYTHNFSWLGRPILQFPQDMVALQEIIWNVKPDLIIETGIAHGGSLIFSASLLELIGRGKVLGIDIDIRKHNKKEIQRHLLHKRITMIEGSSIDKKIIDKVYNFAKKSKKILLVLDSNHTHKHVLSEMKSYSPLVKKGSYMIVFDTVIEDLTKELFKGTAKRPWEKGNNPKTAVHKFLKSNKRFKIDKSIEKKLLITVAPDGYLKCIK